jgi:glycosyltransferase involved in cell wall biosynthesis
VPVRVLFCIDSMIHGGTEKQLAGLIRRFDRERVVPYLCTLKPSAIDLSALPCQTLELGFRSFGRLDAVGAARRLRHFLRAHDIDIVHTFFQDATIMGLLGSLGRGASRRVAAFRDLGFWRTRRKALQMKLAYAWFDGFVANSRAIAHWAARAYRIPPARIEVIYNGVSVPGRWAAARPPATPTVGTVANLDRPVKRVDLFIEAAALVAREIDDVRFIVVGDGPLRPGLVELARTRGLGDRIEFVGAVADPAGLVAGFDVGVMCSDSEGFSNAILEFMAAGVPTVARRVDGNIELVESGVTGLLVDSGDPRAIAGAILELLRDDVRRRCMGEAARRGVQERYGWDRCVRAHEAFYRRLLSGEDGTVSSQ